MLDANLKDQLKSYLEKVTQSIEIVAYLDDGEKSQELQQLLQDIASLSNRISYEERRGAAAGDARTPSFDIKRANSDVKVTFAGIPMGHEFTSLVLALLQVGGHPVKLENDTIEQVKALDGAFSFEVYMSLSCQNCPEVVQSINAMAALNPNVQIVTIDGALYQDEVEKRQIMAVPTIYLNGEVFGQGRMGVEEILAKLDTGASTRAARGRWVRRRSRRVNKPRLLDSRRCVAPRSTRPCASLATSCSPASRRAAWARSSSRASRARPGSRSCSSSSASCRTSPMTRASERC